MWDLLYYLAGVTMVGTVGFGVLYLYDRDTANDIAQQVSWNAVKAYHKANLEVSNLKDGMRQIHAKEFPEVMMKKKKTN